MSKSILRTKYNKIEKKNRIKAILKFVVGVCIVCLIVLAYIVAYRVIFDSFSGSYFLSEDALEKKDWLSFFGVYLSFAGTLTISIIAVWQTRYYNRKNEEHRQEEYEQKTKPKLSISIIEKNSWIEGMRDSESPEGKILTRLDHDNITLEIRNVGEYPTTNIYIEDKFVEPSLLSGEKTIIHVARPDSPDLENYPQLFIELSEESYTEEGLPKSLLLQSDDINGRLVGHEFKLDTQDGKVHYSYSEEPYYLT